MSLSKYKIIAFANVVHRNETWHGYGGIRYANSPISVVDGLPSCPDAGPSAESADSDFPIVDGRRWCHCSTLSAQLEENV